MHAFPPSLEVQFLLTGDAWITQIVLNATTMALQLANGCRIEVEGAVTYVGKDGAETLYDKEWFRAEALKFHVLLGKRLVTAETHQLDLTLTFENEARLIIHSDLSPYEAGAVLGPDNAGFYF